MLLVSHGSIDLMSAKTCAFAHVQNSERGFSSPSSGIFLLMRYFQALKQSENFMPLWTVQLFQIYLSNGEVEFRITRYILFSSFLKQLHLFLNRCSLFREVYPKHLIIFLTIIIFHIHLQYLFLTGLYKCCAVPAWHVAHHMVAVLHIWLLSLSVSADYSSLAPAKVPGIGNTTSAGWRKHYSQAKITATLNMINAGWYRSLIQSLPVFIGWCDMSGCHYPPSKNKVEKH